ncbi:MAG TPA: carboxypeptidase regulatory-like domain-containing protein [Gaiellaceae bacterium]
MKRKRRTFAFGGALFFGALVVLLSLGVSVVLAGGSATQPSKGSAASKAVNATASPTRLANGFTVGRSYHNDASLPLRRMPALPMGPTREHIEANPNPKLKIRHQDRQDRTVQQRLASPNMPSPILNFDGIPFPGVNCNCAPPDTNGEVGLSQYVQIVNTGFQVFDKNTGASVFGPVAITSLWQGFGGVCETNGFGDPVALYDQLANRWVITQFAGSGIPTDECVAVSQGTDAAGSYNRYAFHLGSEFFDYPKLGVWPDGYYMSMNVFNSSGTAFLGPQAFALDRTQMLAGNPATFIATPLGSPSDDGFMPGDLDGSNPPPAGAPNPFLSVGLAATWPLHRFHVDFANPGNSTFDLGGTLTPAAFTALCPFTRSCVPQLGTADMLDAIADRGMFRSAYRRFADGHEALVGNMTVSSGGVAGIRWFEVNNVTSGTPSFVQESTYQPDSTWRWMGSAAMDGNGNMALGFSASDATINPQIRYAGRLATDPPNDLTQGETHLFDGTGSQTDTVNRWGDYSDMTIDPVDDCTFWYTQEYYQTTGSFNWRTRIGSFKFPSCTSAPSGTLEGTVSDSSTNAPIAGAQITVDPIGASTTTDASGHYSLTLPVGDYDVTASHFGYTSQTQPASVTDGGTTTLDFLLVAAPSGSLSGTVSDDSGNPVENATVTINSTPIPPETTDANGNYSFASVPEGTYSVTATAGKCTTPDTETVTISGATTQDFTLPTRHDSFGYFCRVEASSYEEGDTPLALSGDDSFTSVTLPFSFSLYGQTYTSANVCTNGYITFLTGNCFFGNSSIPSTFTPNGAIYPYWDDLYIDGSSSMWTKTLSGPNRFVIEWRNARYFDDTTKRVDVEVVLYENGQILTQYRNIDANAREQGGSATLGIENAAGTDAFQYSFNEPTIGSPDFAIRYLLPPSGFVEGHVTDANDDAAIGGASVKALQGGNVVRETSTDGSGFYRMQLPVGDYTIEASKTNYETGSADVTVAEDATVTQDFALRTPRGEVSPTSLEIIAPPDQIRTRTLTLRNTGSMTMTWDVKESGGGPAGPSRAELQKNANYDPNARTTRGEFAGKAPVAPNPGAPGDVLRQWPTNLELGWGVGYTGHVWLSDVDGGFCGPTCQNHEFLVDGTPTGAAFATPWAGAWPADMASVGASEMCQLDVGGDNGIHCWDTNTGATTRSITGGFPWTAISQRGLAYRPDDDSFYVGGWNQGILYHVAGFSHATPGQVLNQCNAPDFNISGLAWNPAVGQVWEATNSPTDTIIRVDPVTCAAVSSIAHPRPGFNGAGLEMNEDGNLWMIAQDAGPNTAYLVDSGVPAFSDVPWLSESPTSGTVAPGASQNVTVTVDTHGMTPGVYQATLTFRTNSGRQPNLSVPVRLIVPAYEQAFDSGDGPYTDTLGDLWSTDRAYTAANGSGYVQSPSKTVDTRSAIGGTLDDKLYQSARITPMTYRFTGLPAGVYQVEMRFAEIQNKKPGQRQFDVIVNGAPYAIALDISALVGKNYALDRSLFVTVPASGEVSVQLANRQAHGDPILNGIRVTHRPDRH